jgi:hypothetical protein
MANDNEFDPFARGLKAQLDRSSDAIDPLTRARLRAMRLRATAPAARSSWLRWRLPAALAAGVAIAVALHLAPTAQRAAPAASAAPLVAAPVLAAGDVDLIADADALDLDEDLEFYLWLHAQSGEG